MQISTRNLLSNPSCCFQQNTIMSGGKVSLFHCPAICVVNAECRVHFSDWAYGLCYPGDQLEKFRLLGEKLHFISSADNGNVDVAVQSESGSEVTLLRLLFIHSVTILNTTHLEEIRSSFAAAFPLWCSKAQRSKPFRWMCQDCLIAICSGMLRKRLDGFMIPLDKYTNFDSRFVNLGMTVIQLMFNRVVSHESKDGVATVCALCDLKMYDVLSVLVADDVGGGTSSFYRGLLSENRNSVSNTKWFGSFLSVAELSYVDLAATEGYVSLSLDAILEQVISSEVSRGESICYLSADDGQLLKSLSEINRKMKAIGNELNKKRKVTYDLCAKLLSD